MHVINGTNVVVDENGRVEAVVTVPDVGAISDAFYPLCGDAVQTNVTQHGNQCRVRPNTYTRRAVLEPLNFGSYE
jgi:hypothetical protein